MFVSIKTQSGAASVINASCDRDDEKYGPAFKRQKSGMNISGASCGASGRGAAPGKQEQRWLMLPRAAGAGHTYPQATGGLWGGVVAVLLIFWKQILNTEEKTSKTGHWVGALSLSRGRQSPPLTSSHFVFSRSYDGATRHP